MKYIKWQSLPLCKKNVDDFPKNYNEHLKDNRISKHVFMHSAKLDQNAEIATLTDNLIVEFGEPTDPVHFATKFVCAYYGPKDLVNHDVVTTIASIKEGSPEWAYFERKRLKFLIFQCRNILQNTL